MGRGNGEDLRLIPTAGTGDPLTKLIIPGRIPTHPQDRRSQLTVGFDIFRVQIAENRRTASASHITSQELILLSPDGTDQIRIGNELPSRMRSRCLFPLEEPSAAGSTDSQRIHIMRMIIRGDMGLSQRLSGWDCTGTTGYQNITILPIGDLFHYSPRGTNGYRIITKLHN